MSTKISSDSIDSKEIQNIIFFAFAINFYMYTLKSSKATHKKT